jgi:hypothetical protein
MDDPQIGRFWSVDPLCDSFPHNSTYAFSENKVTGYIELEGKEALSIQDLWRSAGITSSTDPKQFVKNVGKEALKPKNWAEGYAQAGGMIAPLVLVGIMTEGSGEGEMINAEMNSPSLKLNAPSTSEAPTQPVESSGGSAPSPNVQNVLNSLNGIKNAGGTVTVNPVSPTQEFNITIQYGTQKLDFRIETHDLPLKLGGKGSGSPVRHMNVDLTPGKKSLPNSGHVILKP